MTEWKDLPDSEGDWLWVYMWDCGCCVAKCGICWVTEYITPENEDDERYYEGGFLIPPDNKLCIHWETREELRPDMVDGKFWVNGFMKIDLPDRKNEEFEDV